MTKQLRFIAVPLLVIVACFPYGCTVGLTPEQVQQVAALKDDLGRIRQEIAYATTDDAAYTGGLIKSLIRVRLEILKIDEALVDQRIHALESGARITTVVNATETDPARAAELAKEIEGQRAKVAESRTEADRYSGGLVQAMAETAVATNRNTLAMLEQQYLIAKYGLVMPLLPAAGDVVADTKSKSAAVSGSAEPSAGVIGPKGAEDCLEIETFDSSVLSSNDVYTELAWKVDVVNSCTDPYTVRVTFTIYDKDEFELDSDYEDVYVPAMGTGKARGKMLVSPPEKARRMSRQGANLSLR